MKKKMNLKNLKVESFVTNFNSENENTVKGGITGNGCTMIGTFCNAPSALCVSLTNCNACNTYQNTCQAGCGATNTCPPPLTMGFCASAVGPLHCP